MIAGSVARTQLGKCETHTDNERHRQMVKESESQNERPTVYILILPPSSVLCRFEEGDGEHVYSGVKADFKS